MQIWSWSCPLTFRPFFLPANDQQQEVPGVIKSLKNEKLKFSIKMEGAWGRWVVIT